LLATHCVIMTDSDIARVGGAGITVAHAPKINLTGGFLPVTSKLRRAGAKLALGTDNMHGDMIEVMRWALVAGRLQDEAITPFWSSTTVFEMATRGGARAIGRSADLGMLRPGMKADVVLIDFRRAHLIPAFNPVGTLVHCGQGRDVNHVIVNGDIVVADGRATKVDEASIRHEGEAAARRLWTRVTANAPEMLRPR
jgi:5-methylthioadenosine/S-adenosylhomocysteine deaminase